jgi:hypothetical protein
MQGELLATRNWHDLAERTSNRKTQSSGINFHRKIMSASKAEARNSLLPMYGMTEWPTGLSILTLPGANWNFERQLLGIREVKRFFEKGNKHEARSDNTHICAIEQDESIFRYAIKKMPGIHRGLACLAPAEWATATVRTYSIARFHRCSFEVFAQCNNHDFDAAWLDFSGTITMSRMEAIKQFWPYIRWRLTITACLGRYPQSVKETMQSQNCATLVHWILNELKPRNIADIKLYREGMSMFQLTINK